MNPCIILMSHILLFPTNSPGKEDGGGVPGGDMRFKVSRTFAIATRDYCHNYCRPWKMYHQ